jgi:hypothetical protein
MLTRKQHIHYLNSILSLGAIGEEISHAPSTIGATLEPSTAPTSISTSPSPVAITSAPTAEMAFAVEAAAYSLLYTFGGSGDIETTNEDFAQLGDVTGLFLAEYLQNVYSNTFLIELEDALTALVGFSDGVLPIEVVYSSTALFSEASIFYPPKFEIEQAIRDAFTDFDSNTKYVDMVQNLPVDNIFGTVTIVKYAAFESGS